MNSVITILFFILSGPQQFQNRVNCLCFAWPLAAAINDECHESKNTFLKKFIFDKKHWFGMRYNQEIQSDTDYVIYKGWLHFTRWCILWQADSCKEKVQKCESDTANYCNSWVLRNVICFFLLLDSNCIHFHSFAISSDLFSETWN